MSVRKAGTWVTAAACALLGLATLASGVGPAAATPSCSGTATVTCTFSTLGSDTFAVPPGVTSLHAVVDGAAGGGGYNGVVGSFGGEATATLSVTPCSVLTVDVGTQGGTGTQTTAGAGGASGSGSGGNGATSGAFGSGGGGGASGIRQGTTPLIVAGGGGGSGTGDSGIGGNGGGLVGAPGGTGTPNGGTGGGGGNTTLSTGGALGTGANGAPNGNAGSAGQGAAAVPGSEDGGGGGGGVFGGGSGGDDSANSGGGGGGGSGVGPTGTVFGTVPTMAAGSVVISYAAASGTCPAPALVVGPRFTG